MIHPAPWPEGFDVDVNVSITPVGAHSPRAAFAGSLPIDAPGLVAAVPAPDQRPHAADVLLEIGPMVSPLTVGMQGGLAIPLSPAWRLAGSGAIDVTFDGEYVLGVAAAELRHVGVGRKQWDFGPELGYASDGHDPVAFAAFRIARTWEMSNTAISLALTDLIILALRS